MGKSQNNGEIPTTNKKRDEKFVSSKQIPRRIIFYLLCVCTRVLFFLCGDGYRGGGGESQAGIDGYRESQV